MNFYKYDNFDNPLSMMEKILTIIQIKYFKILNMITDF